MLYDDNDDRMYLSSKEWINACNDDDDDGDDIGADDCRWVI